MCICMYVPKHVYSDVRVLIGREKGVQSVTESSFKFPRGTKGHDDKHHLRLYHHIDFLTIFEASMALTIHEKSEI